MATATGETVDPPPELAATRDAKSHYQVLGLDEDKAASLTDREIQAAYRSKSMKVKSGLHRTTMSHAATAAATTIATTYATKVHPDKHPCHQTLATQCFQKLQEVREGEACFKYHPRPLPFAHLLTCSRAHLLTCSRAHVLTCSRAHLLTCSLAHVLTCSLAHST